MNEKNKNSKNFSQQLALKYQKFVIAPQITCFKPSESKSKKTFAQEVSHSLNQKSKFISPKFFYNERGSELFEKICQQPEYYLTRTEIKILENQLKQDLSKYMDGYFRLVELGSGSSVKTKLLLDVLASLQEKIEYLPIDISGIVKKSSKKLQKKYHNLHVTGIIDTYEEGLQFIKDYDDKNNLIVFLGSSFGNFAPVAGQKFLQTINKSMKGADLFLIGLDLVKKADVLESAYDDLQGLTALFNLNVLSRINEELSANFDLTKFEHHATYNQDKQRIEMYLKSLEKQTVQIPKADLHLEFDSDELILTEYSHKYTIPQINKMMRQAGFNIEKIWYDQSKPYAVVLASKV